MKRKEIKEKMEKEMTEGETANQAFRVNNPLKTLNNSVSKIEDTKNQLEIAGKFFRESGWFYNIHTISNIEKPYIPSSLFIFKIQLLHF